jgi:hypothetical protein
MKEDIVDFDSENTLAETAEGKLMIAMLQQAVIDATYKKPKSKNVEATKSMTSKNRVALRDQEDAIRWLFDDNDVYEMCCSIAGIHKEKIRALVAKTVGAEIVYPLVSKWYIA